MSLPDEYLLKDIANKYNIDIASKFQSSQEMGGDFWGCRPINDTKLAIYNIDVSGHGIDSALSALRIHTLLHATSHQLQESGETLDFLNKKLFGLFPPGQFSTMFYGIIDIKENLLTYATAATPNPMMIYSYKNDMTTQSLDGSGFPLGAMADATFQTQSIKFEQGDSLILYSDAITEALDKNGELFGEERLEELLKIVAKQKDFSAHEVLQQVLSAFYKECGTKLNDDLTFNIYHRFKSA
jgi:sigma-B regulation protein RsbU (phosphoserine phosphatase)